MKKTVLFLFAAMSISAFAGETRVRGYLVDLACSRDFKDLPKLAAGHSKQCLQMKFCRSKGYAVFTNDNQVIKFDQDGIEKAAKFLSDISKANNIKVTVTGTVDGDRMTVTRIELESLP